MERALTPRWLAAVLAVLFGSAPLAAQTIHPHYTQLLDRGTYALETGDTAEATRLLRLACFGMLEKPPVLADCLTRLAVSQAAAGDDDAFSDTFRRLVEVEDRFGAYSAADISAGMRAAFESEATARIPARALSASRTFARLAPATGNAADAAQTTSSPVRPLGPEPKPEPAETTPTSAGSAPVISTPATPPADFLDEDERQRLDRARELVAAAHDRGDLEEPARLAREVADANPSSREAQHLAAVIAYRATRWEEAVRYFRQGGDPDDTSPERLFYFAVSLYEIGEREEAAAVLRRSLPGLERTPFVRSYESKILGEGAATDAGLSRER